MTNLNHVFTTKEACQYLGVHPQTLEQHLMKGHLAPDRRLDAGDRLFTKATLDAFIHRFNTPGMTLKDIMDRYGVTYTQARYAMRIKRTSPVAGQRGRGSATVYSPATVRLVAEAEGWTVKEPAAADDDTGADQAT